MKIALYYPWLYLKSGGERTVVELLARSRHEWQIITNHFDKESTYPELKNAPIVELAKVSVKRTFLHAGLAAWRMLAQKLPLGNADALVIACDGLGDLVTFRNHDIPVFNLCFTPLRAAFDPYYRERYLEMRGNSSVRRLALAGVMSGFRTVDRLAWRNYSHVFAISEEVRRRILLGRLCKPEKVSIAYPGVDLSHVRPGDVYDRYFLVAGRIMWTKNHDLAIRAFQSLRRSRPDLRDFRLVIAGFVDQKSRPYIDYLRQLGGDCQNIEFVESPSDARLNDLYQRAYAVLYTPFNEDWGLIPLEAMAFEKPVLAVDRGGPRETIANGETGFLLPPEPDAFAKTMEMLADDPQMVRKMGAAGRLSIRRFEWREFCNTMDDQLERVSAVNAPLRGATASRATPRPDAHGLNSEHGCQPDR